MPITTRVGAVFSSQGFSKLHAYALAQGVDMRQVVVGVVEAWLDGKSPDEFAPKPKRVAGESRTMQEVRGMFLQLGPKTINELTTCGRSVLSIRMCVKQLVENGELICTEGERGVGMGRAPYVYVPIPSKMQAAAEAYEQRIARHG